MTRRNQHYPPELRERAVRMVAEVIPNHDSQWAAIGAVAQMPGVGSTETVRKWVRQVYGARKVWRAPSPPPNAPAAQHGGQVLWLLKLSL